MYKKYYKKEQLTCNANCLFLLINLYKKVVQDCEILLQRLNPEFAEQKQQKQEIDNLKAQMSEMMNGMKELMAQIKKETPKS